jgi:hypothetical protein
MAIGIRGSRDARGRSIDLGEISDLLDRMVRAWNPREIWLFGSRALGEGRDASDWDLLAVVPDDLEGVDDPLTAWTVRRDSGVPCDLILVRDAEFTEARNTPNTLAFEATHRGVRIYER